MSKEETEALSNDLLIADALLRLRAIENLLISKGVFTQEEWIAEMELVTRQIAKTLLENAKVEGDLEAIINSLSFNGHKN